MGYTRLIALSLALGGCVTAFPEEALRSVNRTLTVRELRAAPGAHRDERVILGGEILATRPKVGETEIEVLARRLQRDDSPEQSDRSDGRFLLRTTEFLDPAIYAPGRRITVIGVVGGEEQRMIGDLPYHYPVIRSERLRLWPPDVVTAPVPYPPPPYPWSYWPYPPPYRYWPYWW